MILQRYFQRYFQRLYEETMGKAYALAHKEIASSLARGGECLDCGAHDGGRYKALNDQLDFETWRYFGVEWNPDAVQAARTKGLNVIQGDLNKLLAYPDGKFQCVFALSVLEHLLNPCQFLREAHRVLKEGGVLVILTPNISTYFTALLILLGKMPSSGPHPDSNALLEREEVFKVSSDQLVVDSEGETPVHRHLVVFSYRVLRSYLGMVGYGNIRGYGFGLYPFPNFAQPLLEKVDPYHCHQMVFVASK